MNSVRDVSITDRAKTVLESTLATWSCDAPPIRKKAPKELAPASTTEPGVHVGKKPVSLKPSDPYPTWPFTQVEPGSLARWCRANLRNPDNYEEAPF